MASACKKARFYLGHQKVNRCTHIQTHQYSKYQRLTSLSSGNKLNDSTIIEEKKIYFCMSDCSTFVDHDATVFFEILYKGSSCVTYQRVIHRIQKKKKLLTIVARRLKDFDTFFYRCSTIASIVRWVDSR